MEEMDMKKLTYNHSSKILFLIMSIISTLPQDMEFKSLVIYLIKKFPMLLLHGSTNALQVKTQALKLKEILNAI